MIVTPTTSDAHLLELAIMRNAAHGLQLSREDKQDMARRIYNSTAERERSAKKQDLARILSVSASTVQEWLSRIDKDTRATRDRRIFDKWLACWTQEEIAASEDMSQKAVSDILVEFPILEKLLKTRADARDLCRAGVDTANLQHLEATDQDAGEQALRQFRSQLSG